MRQRLIISEEEKRNIQEMYGLINEQGSKQIGGSDIPNNWIGKEYPASLSGDFLNVETDEGKVQVVGVVYGLRGSVEGTLTTKSFKELYDKFGYRIYTIDSSMGGFNENLALFNTSISKNIS